MKRKERGSIAFDSGCMLGVLATQSAMPLDVGRVLSPVARAGAVVEHLSQTNMRSPSSDSAAQVLPERVPKS